jgi:hypothetical protein
MASPHDAGEAEANKALAERIAGFRESLDEALSTLAAPFRFSTVSDTEPDGAIDPGPLLRYLTIVRTATSQREVLSALLELASTCYARAVLFISRSDALVAWDARHVQISPGTGAGKGPHLTIPTGGDHLAARAMASGGIATAGPEGPGFVLTEALGGFVPARSAAVPLVVRGRTAALLYGDCGTGRAAGMESLFAVIGSIGGLSIEALGSGRRHPAAGASRGDAATLTSSPGKGARRATASGGARAAGLAGEAFEDDAVSADELPSMTDAGASASSPQAPEEAELQALLGEIEGMPRETARSPLAPEERRADADAHRLASLLVSELLLYNEEAVILGRRHHDLSRRLEKEIEKSRQTYVARVTGAAHGAGRYFEDELVRVLAEGDPSVLGG